MTLVLGFLMGMIGFVIDLPAIGHEKVITERWGIPFMMQAWWAFCICSAIYVMTSLVTLPPPEGQVAGLTWENPLEVLSSTERVGLSDPRLLAAGLLSLMVVSAPQSLPFAI
ncbi:MAG: hypothetical protein L0387_11010 [Acidobacteria bacterium]|nr:hypothetical protein [Acidobacteriota bacterium]MCI0721956.1 hypothetical protein [Acidobacteriota bacterium]